MVLTKERISDIDCYLAGIKEEAAKHRNHSNPLIDRLHQSGISFNNLMDAFNKRQDIPVLILSLCEQEFLEIEDSKTEGCDKKKIGHRVISSYNLAHFFANVAEDRLPKDAPEWPQYIAYINSMDEMHLPCESEGFLTPEYLDAVGGIDNWMLLRNLVFKLYMPELDN